jgi:putative transposase
MSDGGYKIRNKEGVHFVTFAVVDWVDVFTRQMYCDIVVESLRYCQNEKGLLLHAWCIMSNHIHLAISATNNNPSDILRDFKKFTAKKIIDAIKNNPKESRKEWMIDILKNMVNPILEIPNINFGNKTIIQKKCGVKILQNKKINCIHNNPVTAGIVTNAEAYLYSSARDYYFGKQCGLLKIDFL